MLIPRSIKHCKTCGGAVHYQVPADDNRDRAVCTVCHTVHYENPLNVVGTVPVWGDQVLLRRRNIEPRYGMWTLPAGFMELGESVAETVVREVLEETGLVVEPVRLIGVYSGRENQFTYPNGDAIQGCSSFFACRVIGGHQRA